MDFLCKTEDSEFIAENRRSDISTKHREDFELWRENAIEQQTAYYNDLKNLTEDDQAFLKALQTPFAEQTIEQQEDYEIWEEIAIEQHIAYYNTIPSPKIVE